MKVLVIQPKIGMRDMVIYLPYIHAIAKKFQTSVSILVKENSRAKLNNFQFLTWLNMPINDVHMGAMPNL